MGENINLEEYLKDIITEKVKKLLIAGVKVDIVYDVFSELSKSEIDKIEETASVIRKKNFDREFWKLYYDEHKDEPDNIVVQIFNEAEEEAKRDYNARVIKNMKADNVSAEIIQSIFPKYTPEQMNELVTEYDKKQKEERN